MAPTTTKTATAIPKPTLIFVPTFQFMGPLPTKCTPSIVDVVVYDDSRVEKNPVEIEYHQALVANAFQVVRANAGQRRQRHLQTVCGHTPHAHDDVREQAQLQIVAAHQYDPMQVGQALLWKVEQFLKVDDRQNAAAHVDDSEDERWRTGQRRQIPKRMHSVH